jgi:hypothetical protein
VLAGIITVKRYWRRGVKEILACGEKGLMSNNADLRKKYKLEYLSKIQVFRESIP